MDYLKGLLKIIREIENGDLAETVIVHGSSYFFSTRTAYRFGFSVEKATIGEKLNIALNYLDLLWMYSLANRKLSLPDLRQIKKATVTGNILMDNKPRIEQLLNKMEKTVANKKYPLQNKNQIRNYSLFCFCKTFIAKDLETN